MQLYRISLGPRMCRVMKQSVILYYISVIWISGQLSVSHFTTLQNFKCRLVSKSIMIQCITGRVASSRYLKSKIATNYSESNYLESSFTELKMIISLYI